MTGRSTRSQDAKLASREAAELVAEGLSHDEIAASDGYLHRGSPPRAVFKAIVEHEAKEAGLLRAMELDRLDYSLTKLWPKIEETI